MEIGLVSCTKKKQDSPSRPRELYQLSPLFRKASQYADMNHDQWYVLSAKHGLLLPDSSIIEPYDETLSDLSQENRQSWADTVFEDLSQKNLLDGDVVFVLHAGRDYYEPLLPRFDSAGVSYSIPTEGLKLGETLSWYNDHLSDD